jgi:hypothetical protein
VTILAYLGSEYKISFSWMDVQISLHPFVWICVFGLMRFRDGCDRGIMSVLRSLYKYQKELGVLPLVTRAGFAIVTPRQSNSLPNGKVHTH